MQRRFWTIITCGAALGAALLLKPTPATGPATVSQPAPEAPGYRVYIDPATGGITSTPSAADAAAIGKDIEQSLSTSHEGLEVVPAPGGGVMIDLQGRFQHTSVATIDEDGNLAAPCLSGLPADNPGEAGNE